MQVQGVSGVVKLAAAWHHTCAITGGAKLYCWGANSNGQLGLGDKNNRNTATLVNLSDVVDVAPGADHTCAVADGGRVGCWAACRPRALRWSNASNASGDRDAVVTGHSPTCVAYGEDTAVVTGHSPTCVAYGEDTAVVTGHSPTIFAEDARSVRVPENLAARGLQRGSPIWTTCTLLRGSQTQPSRSSLLVRPHGETLSGSARARSHPALAPTTSARSERSGRSSRWGLLRRIRRWRCPTRRRQCRVGEREA